MSEADFQPLVEWLQNHPSWILFSVFLISFVESLALAGVIVPGVLMLFLVAAVSGKMDISLYAVLSAGFVGAVLGDGISFYLGRYFKDSLHRLWPFSRYPDLLSRGESFFYQHGGKSVMLGRFIGPIRPVIPIVVGMLGMSPKRFALFNILSAIIWAPFYILPGYLTGKASSWMAPAHFYELLIGLSLTIIVVLALFRFASQNLQQGQTLTNRLIGKQETSLLYKILSFFTVPPEHNTSRHNAELPTASFFLLILTLCSFSIWSYLANNTQVLLAIDQLVNQVFVSVRQTEDLVSRYLEYLGVSLTLLGDEKFLYLSFSVFVMYLVSQKHIVGAISVALAGLGTAFITHTLKNFWMINRPDVVLMPPESFAYPSGHSSGSTVLYGLIAAFIAQSLPLSKRWWSYAAFFIPMTLIALSRIMLNVHWFSDIVGGILLGLMICGSTRLLYSKYHAYDLKNGKALNYKTLAISLSGWLITVIIYQAIYFESTLERFQLAP